MDIKDNDRYKMFTRRATIMSGGALGVMGTLFGRLYYIQVLESEKYRVLADDNRVSVELLAPRRGKILDRFGTELATNVSNFRLVMVPNQVGDVEAALDSLHKIIPLTPAQRERFLRKEKSEKNKNTALSVLENLDWETFAKANIWSPDLDGVYPDAGVTRSYPFGLDLAHVVGYVRAVAEDDREEDTDPLLSLPEFRVGKNGIEKSLDLEMRGAAGNRQVEVNVHGRIVRELARDEGQSGKDVVLTLDLELQSYAMRRMEGESGAAVVMDIHNGDILALASVPGFDPNDFNLGLSQAKWDSLRNDEYKPLLNKAIAGQYPPGSTFKMLVALAALEAGITVPGESVTCLGSTRLGNQTFHCWKRGGHGVMNMRNAIKHSCDVYFYEIAQRLGIDRIEQMAKRFGLGKTLDFGIPGEKPGLVPSKGWKIANTSERWQKGETLIAGIGQGYLLTTPLQLAVMTAQLANGGKLIKPRISRAIGDNAVPIEEAQPIGVSQRNLDLVLGGMNAVSNEAGGTAYGSRIAEAGMELAGKTGTAQVRRITAAERAAGIIKNEDLPWNRRDHALFVAYAPVKDPRYAISVFVEHGGSGSRAAAPIAKDIMKKTLIKDPVRRRAVGPVADTQSPFNPKDQRG